MRMKWSPGVVASMFTLALGLSAPPLLAAQGHKHGPPAVAHGPKAAKHVEQHEDHPKHSEKRAEVHPARPHAPAAIVIDRNGHQRIIHEYYATQGLPPGLAKRQSLPPGLSKQLRERGHLPPGLQKRLTPVPPALIRQLPAVPPYYHRYFAGPDLVVVDGRTNTIVAVIRDVR